MSILERHDAMLIEREEWLKGHEEWRKEHEKRLAEYDRENLQMRRFWIRMYQKNGWDDLLAGWENLP